MSRWIDEFNAHAFQATWSALKSSLEQATVDDETVLTSVTELARLKKVVEYLDGMIQEVDPEIVPLTTWDNCQIQGTPCLQHINNYNSNRNVAHITNANSHVDNLLTYIRPYMVLPQAAAASIKRASTAYAKVANEYVDSFQAKATELIEAIETSKDQAELLTGGIETSKASIDELNTELFGDDEVSGVKGEILELASDYETKYTQINEFYNETLVGDGSTLSTKIEISQAKDAIIENQEELEKLIKSVNSEVDDLEGFHTKIFGKLDKDGERVGGLAGELKGRITQLTEFEKTQKIKYLALNNEIEGLIPGATSAGLATAYREMKESFDNSINNSSILFYVSIGLLVLGSIVFSIESISGSGITFVKLGEWDAVLRGLINKIPYYAPVLWLAYYATKRRSESQRLQQEYAHKEALAKSYNSYKLQIEALDDEDQTMQKEFINKAVDAIAHNASQSLDGKHGDKMPSHEVIESTVKAALEAAGK